MQADEKCNAQLLSRINRNKVGQALDFIVNDIWFIITLKLTTVLSFIHGNATLGFGILKKVWKSLSYIENLNAYVNILAGQKRYKLTVLVDIRLIFVQKLRNNSFDPALIVPRSINLQDFYTF